MATFAGEGYSHRALVQRFGVSQSTISRVMQRCRETGDHVRRPGQGRHRATIGHISEIARCQETLHQYPTSANWPRNHSPTTCTSDALLLDPY
jgi:transposase